MTAAGAFEALRPEWTRLALQSRNLFSTWEWASTWWRHFGRGRELLLTPVPDGTVLVDGYSGVAGKVRNGTVSLTTDSELVLLAER